MPKDDHTTIVTCETKQRQLSVQTQHSDEQGSDVSASYVTPRSGPTPIVTAGPSLKTSPVISKQEDDQRQSESGQELAPASTVQKQAPNRVDPAVTAAPVVVETVETAVPQNHDASSQDRLTEKDSKLDTTATDQVLATDAISTSPVKSGIKDDTPTRARAPTVSEWSHQQVVQPTNSDEPTATDDDWQEMPAFATHAIYDDWGKVLAREDKELLEQDFGYGDLGGAGRGYTKVQLDEDAMSATSMDDNTAYLFKPGQASHTLDQEDEGRDVLGQMQATKDILTEGQRIAYVGLVRLSMVHMNATVSAYERTRGTKKFIDQAVESLTLWSQKTMVHLYKHMDIEPAEQIMIEQLATHGVQADDLTPTLMLNARVKNPHMTSRPDEQDASETPDSPDPDSSKTAEEEKEAADDSVLQPSDVADKENLDIDIRWTILCDLFLMLVANSIYDARSRALLVRVASALDISWLDISRFEKRVTDAIEMQESAHNETWNEEEHMQERKKSARNKRLMFMGLATVGGGLVIGLSAGLLAPVIGAGLAAGFTTIGVAGTSTFLGGAGAAALITSTGIITGGTVAVRASSRRMGSVKTFEYRPLHNNKRVNLIITLSGWMAGKVDDVRLPFSTVDPVMGDIYSVLWEPEMLQSMGQTINILATEALTQGLQQLLGSTILTALMGALQLPLILTKLSYLIDNPWSVSMARADQAGLILADSLIDRNLGERPVTLVGFSIGARVIYSCLRELARKSAFGLVHNVYMFGSPVVVNRDEYTKVRTVVSGRFLNGYANNDWILGYLFRATSGGISRVAGLAAVELPDIEDVDVTALVPGHMSYRGAMPALMQKVGWAVESLEFTEIEDPDPDNHQNRQRELINEIEEARKERDEKPAPKGLRALFQKTKKVEPKVLAAYDERADKTSAANADGIDASAAEGDLGDAAHLPAGGVLFDIDSIRAEVVDLAAHGVAVKEIESTMPKLKFDSRERIPIRSSSERRESSVRQTDSPVLEHSRSHDGLSSSRSIADGGATDAESLGAVENERQRARGRTPSPLGHNAWADEPRDVNVSMTFE